MKRIRHIIRICGAAAMLAAAGASGQTAAEPNDLLEQSRALRRRFMVQKASAVDPKTPQQEDTSLMQLIEEVMSLRTPPAAAAQDAGPTLGAAADAAEKPVAAPAAIASQNAASDEVRHKTAVEILRLPGTQQSILYPMELADVLYRAGKPDEALRYYEMALNAVNENDVSARPWLLFQTANCLRSSDAPRAATLYEELIRLYPDSVWAVAAQAQHRIVIWLETRREELQTRMVKRDADEQ